jgi:hypothetical protein
MRFRAKEVVAADLVPVLYSDGLLNRTGNEAGKVNLRWLIFWPLRMELRMIAYQFSTSSSYCETFPQLGTLGQRSHWFRGGSHTH